MKDLNFVRGRWRQKQLTYIGIDLGFMILVAFISMFILSIVFSWSSDEDIKVERYIQTQITKLNKNVAEYPTVKSQRDKLLDVSSDLANIKASQYYILLGLEKISRAITDQLYITNINYVANTDILVITGEVRDLKLLSIFMKNLEIEFRVKKVELKNLGSEKNGQRSFSLEFKFGEGNAFKGESVKW
ncbi:PilN domain-containing protein [Francisella philomiragia]|uniref:PilN domain-containing protein n=1 Tax=Francisella philomiragia TaxID=28110 RepID=UPI0001AF7BB3|nr:PilN domain-containing protein [Francisella philomiragia]AJI74865.1 fimbrial assembly family protein [Francisella philomiragia subsp. philomiragia ATCC 25015]EET21639.1 type IV pili associated protein [Francisella philomiragia subsp. philomiragia ATCC 25015]MBK2025946.1 type IV pili associated protein [Francisella philomiragia]MBK2093467.1 type IV pili associated protein [Francisella philomiragia]MBK2106562.1 type IV pili associated protein [Francisella philomiragia]